jgi:hypothetical protein
LLGTPLSSYKLNKKGKAREICRLVADFYDKNLYCQQYTSFTLKKLKAFSLSEAVPVAEQSVPQGEE